MQSEIEGYFSHTHIESIKVEYNGLSFDFYRIKADIDKCNNTDILRHVIEMGYTAYNIVMKPFIHLPSTKSNPKEKLFDAFFSLVGTDLRGFYAQTLNDYKATGCADTLLNWESYLLSIMPKYDLSPSIVTLGAKRSGKSMLKAQQIRRKYAFKHHLKLLDDADKVLIKEDFAKKKIVYTDLAQFKDILKNNREGDAVFDDAILIGDKRRSMSSVNMLVSQYINFYASQNNAVYSLIQHRDYLDTRFISDSNAVEIVINRGYALLFAMPRPFASLIKDLYGFEDLIKEPRKFFSNLDKGLDALMRLPSYIGELYWGDLTGNDFWGSISFVKQIEQQKSEINEEDNPKNAPNLPKNAPINDDRVAEIMLKSKQYEQEL